MEISYLKNKYHFWRNIFSRLIPFSSLLLILLFFISILFHGQKIAFFISWTIILVLYVWWIIRWVEYVILVFSWIIRYKTFQRLNLNNIFNYSPVSKLEIQYTKKYKQSDLNLNDLYHRIIIPTYQDPFDMIKDSFESIKNSLYDNKKIIITLAGEYLDIENFKKISEKIKKIYWNEFLLLNFTIHKLKNWEIQWKGSNINFAVNSTYNEILKIAKPENVLVHVMDSESIVQDKYFLAMSLEFCLTKNDIRHKTIYQPMLFLLNRFFKAPYFSKVIALSVWAYILWSSIKWIWARAQAVQAQSLKSLLLTNFYSSETITEDWHQYYRTYCVFNWKFQIKPVYSYVLLEPVIWKSILETIKLQYNQIRRWAHWCLDLPYLILCFIDKYNKLPKLRTFYEIFRLIEASVLWGSLQIILFFWSIFLYIIWNWFWDILILFNAFSLLILILVLFFSYRFFPFKDLENKYDKIFNFLKYWLFTFIFMWPLLMVLNWLPALHAQFMILLWKPMWKFKVTKKYR